MRRPEGGSVVGAQQAAPVAQRAARSMRQHRLAYFQRSKDSCCPSLVIQLDGQVGVAGLVEARVRQGVGGGGGGDRRWAHLGRVRNGRVGPLHHTPLRVLQPKHHVLTRTMSLPSTVPLPNETGEGAHGQRRGPAAWKAEAESETPRWCPTPFA